LREVKADTVEIFGVSLLVVKQLTGEYECNDDILRIYDERCLELLREFGMVTIEHISRLHNEEANKLAQDASGYRLIAEVVAVQLVDGDWRKEIVDYLKNPSQRVSRQLKVKAIKYVLLEDELYYRTIDGIMLKCIGTKESKVLKDEIHVGVCGAHQSAYKMKWMTRRNNYFWPTML